MDEHSAMAQNPKVLIIDDDEVFAGIIAHKLKNEGIPVTLASEGEKGLTIASQDQPDIILLDISMPGMDGFEVLKRVKEDPKIAAIPVIIMSNFSQESDIEWGKKLGAKKFIDKISTTPADIVDIVRGEARK